MKIVLTALLAFPISAFAQELRLVTKEYSSPPVKEAFYVLKTDKKVKEGKYQKQVVNTIYVSGFYKNDLKDSTWTFFYDGSKQVSSKGKFKGGKRVGIWEFFSKNGELEKSYNYSEKKLVFYNQKKEIDSKAFVKTENGFVHQSVDRPVINFPNEIEIHHDGMTSNDRVKYPIQAMRQGLTGVSTVSWIIDENGNMSEPIVETKAGNGFDEEALRLANDLKRQIYFPAIQNGKSVATKFTLPLKFGVQ